MNRSLEDKIREQREAMDSLEPSQGLWDKIDQELDQKDDPGTRRLGASRWYWQVAAILFFGLSTYLLIERYQQPPLQTADILYERLGNEFIEIEEYYGQVINLKKEELADYSAHFPAINEQIEQDLHSLDQDYQLLEEEFILSNSQEVVDAMIENLRTRIAILNTQIDRLKELNHTKNEDKQLIEI